MVAYIHPIFYIRAFRIRSSDTVVAMVTRSPAPRSNSCKDGSLVPSPDFPCSDFQSLG